MSRSRSRSSQVKPGQVKSGSQASLGHARSGQVRKSRVGSRQVKPGQVEPTQVKSSQAQSSPVKSSQVKSSQVKSRVKSSQAKPSQAKSSQAKSSQAKSMSEASKGWLQGWGRSTGALAGAFPPTPTRNPLFQLPLARPIRAGCRAGGAQPAPWQGALTDPNAKPSILASLGQDPGYVGISGRSPKPYVE